MPCSFLWRPRHSNPTILLCAWAGTVHLAQKNLAPVCRKLGVDYAPAMTGFSIRGGRSIPDILGVVVCEEHADAVLRGFEQDQRYLP